ncbi:hypothetical protein [Methylotuvimicrobium buryatense]|uniref:hypothetical protein n=1 Tax=Methylotuvimicrobium buryatense TaxID=95641 RepID=UPI00164034E5|nr:hypothetical protein [Methylotuvimicrobium buryatense]
MLDWQVSTAGQIFAPAKSAFTPSMTFADFCSCKICIHAIHGVCRFLLLQNLHSRHPWRLQIFAPRQLLSYMDVMNAENAGAFFCPASPKAPTVGALIHATHGVMQNLHSCHPWQSVAAVKPTRTYSRRPAKPSDRTLNKAQ